jgi:sugar/nucleoside kinase (ribokinase family)
MSAGPDLIAVGEVLLDVIAPPLADGRVVHAPVVVRAGGIPANAARAVALTGMRASVLGRVGADASAAAIRHELLVAGIEPLLRIDPERPTGTFVRSGEAAAADRGASAALSVRDLPEALEARVVLVSGYALVVDDTRAAARTALTRARAELVAVVAPTVSLLSSLDPPRFHELADGATALIVNEAEARRLTGLDPKAACVELAHRYALACVTAADGGAFASEGGPVVHATSGGRRAGDATGAGDALAGVLLTACARGTELAASLAAACEAARATVAV